ncbi:MAG: VCBS repeat-containing protein [Planctomycetes bacterium]|nr:VCBS repeat-containing protein [Planctomycetota bacterium]
MENCTRHRNAASVWNLSLLCALAGGALRTLDAGDCNQNGVEDGLDVLAQVRPAVPTRLATEFAAPWLAAVELTGDGDLDLAATTYQKKIILFSGAQGGDFREAWSVALDLTPTAIVAGDLDADADPDLAVAALDPAAGHVTGAVYVLENRGGEPFLEPQALEPGYGPRALLALDLDRDGDLDLATLNRASRTLSLFYNLGEGGFRKVSTEEFTPAPYGFSSDSFASTDLDGDSHLDLLLVAGSPLRLLLIRGLPEGKLAEPVAVDLGFEVWGAYVADMDGDGRDDVLTSKLEIGSLALFRNRGEGSVEAAHAIDTVGFPLGVLAVDLDRDSALDLAIPTGDGTSFNLLFQGAEGAFGKPVSYYVGPTDGRQVVSGDFDGDGHTDFALALQSGEAVVAVSTLEGRRVAAPEESAGERLRRSFLRSTDFDGDGDIDLAFVSGASDPSRTVVAVDLNDGRGRLSPAVELRLEDSVHALEPMDLEGDGDADLVLAERSRYRGVLLSRNPGDGKFEALVNSVRVGTMTSLRTADFDGDGAQDLALPIEFPASVAVCLNARDGTFKDPSVISWTQRVFSPPVYMVAGDFSGDGLADVIVGPYHDLPSTLYLNEREGRFSAPRTLSNLVFIDRVTVADLDRDGDLDIASGWNDTVRVHLNDGNLGFFDPVSYPVAANPVWIDTDDLNQDGAADLLVASQPSVNGFRLEGELALFLNDGRGSFQDVRHLNVGYRPAEAVLGDFDSDGALDLLALNDGTGRPTTKAHKPIVLSLLRGVAQPPFSRDENRTGAPDECESIAFHRGDWNADDRLDISDGVCVLRFLFQSGSGPMCLEAADANNDGEVNCSDAFVTLSFLFLGTEPPGPPGPPGLACAPDTDLKGSPGFLGCDVYPACP